MLHELGTNAIKYGALSNANGTVTIGWRVSDSVLHLSWEESGGPIVCAPAKRGFGTILIERSAAGEGGEAVMLIDTKGLSWNITLPLREHHSAESERLEMSASVPVATYCTATRPRSLTGHTGNCQSAVHRTGRAHDPNVWSGRA
jgi:hypothetical protein